MKHSLSSYILGAVLILLALSLVIGFLFLNRSANPLTESQKQQALTKILGRPVVLKEKYTPQGSLSYNGKYFSLLYPAAAHVYNQADQKNASPSGLLEEFSFEIKDLPQVYFYAEAKEVPWYLASLADYSGISFRLANPDIYTEKTITVNDREGLVFEKNSLSDSEIYEKTGYFLVNGKIYSFSVQSADQRAEEDMFGKIMITLKFAD